MRLCTMNTAVGALFLALLTGCPHRPLDFGAKGEIRSATELLALTQAAEERVISVNGEGKARIDSPQGKGTVGLFLAASRPELLHLESLDFFGRPQAVLVVSEGRFGLYQGSENRYYRGPATPANVSRFLPVVLPPAELVAVMLGQAPRIPDPNPSLAIDDKAGAYKVTLRQGEVTQTLWIHLRFHRVIRSEIRGAKAYDLAFDDFDQSTVSVFPRKITLTAKDAETEVELRYTDATVNEAPDLTLFDLEPPPNVPVVDVDAEGQAAPPPGTL